MKNESLMDMMRKLAEHYESFTGSKRKVQKMQSVKIGDQIAMVQPLLAWLNERITTIRYLGRQANRR